MITLPFVGWHTGLATFEMFEKLFDAVCPLWKDKLISCSTDGAANMTGRLSRVVTQIQNVVKPNANVVSVASNRHHYAEGLQASRL